MDQGIIYLLVPFVSIFLAFVTKKVHLALGVGILTGLLFLLFSADATLLALKDALFQNVFLNFDNISIILFTLIISMMVHLMVHQGFISSITKKLLSFADNRKSAQFLTWVLGLIVFFDDYANTLIVGNTLRPITDRYKISREKLAYIVDSTAAPVASVALISTWIGWEVNEIGLSLGDDLKGSAYSYFLGSLKYSFYPVFTLIFILLTIIMNKELGSMRNTVPKPFIPSKVKEQVMDRGFFRSLLPIGGLVVSSFVFMLITGRSALSNEEMTLINVIGNANAPLSLLFGSLIGFVLSHNFDSTLFRDNEYFQVIKLGVVKMLDPILILVLAKILGFVIDELSIGSTIAGLLPDDTTPFVLPGCIFLVSALVSFATGSSFSTMSIMYPIALPLVFGIVSNYSLVGDQEIEIIYHSVACVLAGAVFGDHCSPISDTTVLTSIACECNHINHVRTQMPYALAVGMVSCFMSFTLANSGLPSLFLFLIGSFILFMVLKVFGRTPR